MKPAHQLLLLIGFILLMLFWPMPAPPVYDWADIEAICSTDTDCGCGADCLD